LKICKRSSRREQKGTNNEAAAKQAENQKSITERTRATGEKLEQLSQKQDAELSEEMAREHVKRALEKQEEAEKKTGGSRKKSGAE
jgi:hypothetical protein